MFPSFQSDRKILLCTTISRIWTDGGISTSTAAQHFSSPITDDCTFEVVESDHFLPTDEYPVLRVPRYHFDQATSSSQNVSDSDDLYEVAQSWQEQRVELNLASKSQLTKPQRRLIKIIRSELRAFLEDLNVTTDRTLDPRQFHLLDERDFKAQIVDKIRTGKLAPGFSTKDSKTIGGGYNSKTEQITGPLRDSLASFLHTYVHESIHALSAHFISCLVKKDEVELLNARLGLQRNFTQNFTDGRRFHSQFIGLNEAVTELAALVVLKRIKQRFCQELARFYPEEQIETIDCKVSYPSHVIFLECLLRRLSFAHATLDHDAERIQIFRDLFSGNPRFYENLGKAIGKDGFNRIKKMGVQPNEPIEVAAALGWFDAVRLIDVGSIEIMESEWARL
jgi:hypothetical protein